MEAKAKIVLTENKNIIYILQTLIALSGTAGSKSTMLEYDFSVIRTLRTKRGMTADELAAKAGLTRVTVAKIEANNGNPTVGTLGGLAAALGLAPSELLQLAEQTATESPRVHPFQREKLTGRQLVFSDGDLFVLSAPAGTRTEFEPELHGGSRETCLVVSGRVMVTVAGQTVSLGAGEAVRFKALHPHYIEIMEDAVLVMIHLGL